MNTAILLLTPIHILIHALKHNECIKLPVTKYPIPFCVSLMRNPSNPPLPLLSGGLKKERKNKCIHAQTKKRVITSYLIHKARVAFVSITKNGCFAAAITVRGRRKPKFSKCVCKIARTRRGGGFFRVQLLFL